MDFHLCLQDESSSIVESSRVEMLPECEVNSFAWDDNPQVRMQHAPSRWIYFYTFVVAALAGARGP
jgi:hypothetical protein